MIPILRPLKFLQGTFKKDPHNPHRKYCRSCGTKFEEMEEAGIVGANFTGYQTETVSYWEPMGPGCRKCNPTPHWHLVE